MNPIKVLMADDESDVLDVMGRKVAAAGYEVVLARDGGEAWEKIVGENPDIIVLDLNMPRLDGFSLLQRLRDQPPAKKWQPVIIVSARTDHADIKQGFHLEADHYLTKPCRSEDILKAIELMARLIPHHIPLEQR